MRRVEGREGASLDEILLCGSCDGMTLETIVLEHQYVQSCSGHVPVFLGM
jgi:hypothetical protein